MSFIDIIVDEDLSTNNGDFLQTIGENQNANDIIIANKGHYFMSPTLGVGIFSHVNAEYSLTEREAIMRDELKKDGFTIKRFTHFLDSEGNYASEVRVAK